MANDLYSQRGQDWFKTRMDNIASMMSMQNTDPMYQLGALISDYYLKPRLQNWVASQFGKSGKDSNKSEPLSADKQTDVAVATYSPNQQGQTGFYNQQDPTAGIMTKEEMLHTPISNPNENNINTAYMNANREDYGRIPEINNLDYSANQPAQANTTATQLSPIDKAPTQAEINEANNNQINQQVLNNAQQNNANTLNSMMALANMGNVGPAGANIQNMQQNQIAANMSAQQAEDERRNRQLKTAISLFGGGVPLSFDEAPKSSDEGSGADSTNTSSTVTDNNRNTDNTANDDTNYVMTAINRYIDSNTNNPLGAYGNYQTGSNKSTDGTFSGQSMEEMITQKIIDYKNAYNEASAAGDTAGMQAAQQGAEQMRDIARANGISLSGIHEGNSLEDAKKRLDKAINFTSEEDAQTQLLNALYNTKYNYAVAEQQKNQAGMDKASAEADLLREIAKANGIDVTDAGSDVSMEELNQTLQEAQARKDEEKTDKETKRLKNLTTQELLETPEFDISPDDFYQRTYLAMKESNLPEWMARQMASDYSEQYRAKYLTTLQNAMSTGAGINADGTLNPEGEVLLARAIQAGSPEIANLYATQIASPRDAWGYNMDMNKAAKAQEYNQANMATKFNQSQQLSAQEFENTKKLNAYNSQLKLGEAQGMMALQDQHNEQLAARAQAMGASPEQVAYIRLTGKFPSAGRSSNGNSSKSSANETKLEGTISQLTHDLLNSARNDAADDSEKALRKYQSELAKLAPQMEPDTYEFYSKSLVYVFNFLREKKAGNENQAYEYWEYIPEDMRKEYLPEY